MRLARWPRRGVGTVRAMHLGSVDSLHPWRCTRTHEWDDWGAHVNFADQIKFARSLAKYFAAGSFSVFFLRQPFWRLLLAPGARGGVCCCPRHTRGCAFSPGLATQASEKGGIFFPASRAGYAPQRGGEDTREGRSEYPVRALGALLSLRLLCLSPFPFPHA